MPSSSTSSNRNQVRDMFRQSAGRGNKILKPSATQSAKNFILQVELNEYSITKIEPSQANLFGIITIREGSIDNVEARKALGITTNAKDSKDKPPEAKEWTPFDLNHLKKLAQAMLGNKLVVDADALDNISLGKKNEAEGRKYIQFIQACAMRNQLKQERIPLQNEYDHIHGRLNIKATALVGLGLLVILLAIIMFAIGLNVIIVAIIGVLLLAMFYPGFTLFKTRTEWSSAKVKLANHDEVIAEQESEIAQQANELSLILPPSTATKQQILEQAPHQPTPPRTIIDKSISTTVNPPSHPTSGNDSNNAQREALFGKSQAPHSGSYGNRDNTLPISGDPNPFSSVLNDDNYNGDYFPI